MGLPLGLKIARLFNRPVKTIFVPLDPKWPPGKCLQILANPPGISTALAVSMMRVEIMVGFKRATSPGQ
jgi:hypothetical protein